MIRAAESLGYRACLALMTHFQSGTVDYDDYCPPRRSRSRFRSYAEDDEDGGDSAGATMLEVFDEHLTLNHWLDAVDEHSIHSPFFFDFYSRVIQAKSQPQRCPTR